MKKWEQKIETFQDAVFKLNEFLRRQGDEGWELVSVCLIQDYYPHEVKKVDLYFKREVE